MSTQVRGMFAEIAKSYDRGNQILSLGLHHRWRAAAVRLSGAKAGDRVLDCATGTGDLALAFAKAVAPDGEVMGTDFCAEMLEVARRKAVELDHSRPGATVRFEEADTMRLPYPDGAFSISAIAFGIRNLDDPGKGIAEMARVVKPGGAVVVLEFGQPGGSLFGPLYRFYSAQILPRVGGWVSGRREAYEYLHRTSSQFPADARFAELMSRNGRFEAVRTHRLTGGIVYVYVGVTGT